MKYTKAMRTARFFSRMTDLGFTYDETTKLRRIEMTLHRWAELECGDGNDYASWSIERDETTEKPYFVTYPHTGKSYRRRIADREAGALRRLQQIIRARNARAYVDGQCVNPVAYFHQTDPRGCSLYIVALNDIPQAERDAWRAENTGANWSVFPFRKTIESTYTRGTAVCI